jgi:hypothetical protein
VDASVADQRLADRADFHAEIVAREARCHAAGGRCPTDDARITLT